MPVESTRCSPVGLLNAAANATENNHYISDRVPCSWPQQQHRWSCKASDSDSWSSLLYSIVSIRPTTHFQSSTYVLNACTSDGCGVHGLRHGCLRIFRALSSRKRGEAGQRHLLAFASLICVQFVCRLCLLTFPGLLVTCSW